MTPAAAATLDTGHAIPLIAINDPAGPGQAQALGAPFSAVVELRFQRPADDFFGLCSGALIAPTAILTAQHCVRDYTAAQTSVRFTEPNGDLQFTRDIGTIDVMAGYTGVLDGTDLAILTLTQPVDDRAPFRLTSDFVLGETVRFAGYGRNGVGSTGPGTTRDGGRWAADNVIDAFSIGAGYSGPNVLYYADFDDPFGTSNTLQEVYGVPSSAVMLLNEGITAPGDSGGPLLVNRNGEWVIAGVASALLGWSGGPDGFENSPPLGAYGSIAGWTGILSDEAVSLVTASGARFWVIPLPAAGWLLLSGLAGLGWVGWRRRAA